LEVRKSLKEVSFIFSRTELPAIFTAQLPTLLGHPLQAALSAKRDSVKKVSKSKKASSSAQVATNLFHDDTELLIRELSMMTLLESQLSSAATEVGQRKLELVRTLLSRGIPFPHLSILAPLSNYNFVDTIQVEMKRRVEGDGCKCEDCAISGTEECPCSGLCFFNRKCDCSCSHINK